MMMNNSEYDSESTRATNKALNEVNVAQNSQFALAIIQSLLNNGTNFESFESVHFFLFGFFFSGSKKQRFPST